MRLDLPRTVLGLLLLLAIAHTVGGGRLPVPGPGAGPVAAAGVMSAAQIGALAGQAGFSGYGRSVAVGVAEAESGGRPDARNLNGNGSLDRGLWQINDRAHPEVSDACAFEAACSARAAFVISRGGRDWTPWTTYNTGAYLAYLPGGA